MGKFVIRKTPTGYTFRLKAGNGEILCVSEVYNAEQSCRNGIESVITNAAVAAMEDQTAEGFAAEKHPKFEMYLDKKEEYRFRLKARNGEIIAASEGYQAKTGCENGIASVRKNAADSTTVMED